MHHALTFTEGAPARDVLGGRPAPVVRRAYRVVRDLFKRGETYTPGDLIELDPLTAQAFLAAGDIEENTP